MKLNDVSICIKTFYRPSKLRKCLESISKSDIEFNTIYVADDGDIDSKKRSVYEDFEERIDLEVLDLDFDLGLAASRNRILDEVETKFILLMDDDMALPSNIDLLYDIMIKEEELGGIAGIMDEYGNKRAGAHDIFIEGEFLLRDIREDKREEVRLENRSVEVYKMDFIPTCSILRTEIFEEIRWDENYTIEMEHLDFFLDHKINSDWEFAVTEEVVFDHYPGGDQKYQGHRQSEQKHHNSREYFLDKWGLKDIVDVDKLIHEEKGLAREIKTGIKKKLPPRLIVKIRESGVMNYAP